MEGYTINVLCVGIHDVLQAQLKEYLDENHMENYSVNCIDIMQYTKQISEMSDKNLVILVAAQIFAHVNELKQFKMINCKYILVTKQESANFIKMAQIKGFDIYYEKSSIDTLMYKITNSYRVYKKEFKYKSIGELPAEEKGKIITFYSPKGGTGTTTIAVNTALKYAQKGLKTLLVDLSQYSFVMKLFDKEPRSGGLGTILTQLEKGRANLQDTLQENIKHYVIEKISIDVLAGNQPLKMDQFDGERTQILFRQLRQLDYDVIVVDTSSELNIRHMVSFELSDYIGLITNADVFAGLSLIQFKEF